MDLLRRDRTMWIIDFGDSLPEDEAAKYEFPFQIVGQRVQPERAKVKRKRYRDFWWLHAEPCSEMRKAIVRNNRFLVTPTVSKHRIFAWWTTPTLPDHPLVAFGRADDYFFGVLHSRVHETWALELGTRLETRPRYTPTTCFETFPMPKPTPAQEQAIATAALELNELRERWLNPPEWTRKEVLEFPGTPGGPWSRYIEPGTNTVRYPRIVPKDDTTAAFLKKRTLTNLYNERPAWLDLAHKKLDSAVFAAYGWNPAMTDDELLAALLALNHDRAAPAAASKPIS